MPKLTFRDLFAVVTIVALALGWWVDRSRLARNDAALVRELHKFVLGVKTDSEGNRKIVPLLPSGAPPGITGYHHLP